MTEQDTALSTVILHSFLTVYFI